MFPVASIHHLKRVSVQVLLVLNTCGKKGATYYGLAAALRHNDLKSVRNAVKELVSHDLVKLERFREGRGSKMVVRLTNGKT